MIYLFKVLYYQYFRFYQRFEQFGEEPHAHARYSLGFNLLGFLLPLISFPLNYFFCFDAGAWFYVSIPLAVLILLYFFHKKGLDEKIEQEQPKLLKSTRLSIIFSIIFWAGSFAVFFMGAKMEKTHNEKNCIECINCK